MSLKSNMNDFFQYEDISGYLDFINDQIFAGRPLNEQVAELQYLYLEEEQPWVVAFSGGKDSTAILTLMFFALLGLSPEQRKHKVYVVFCDTLAEVPTYLSKTLRTLKAVQRTATLLDLPIETKIIKPKTQDTFWARLLGRGYPAPNLRLNRWCTEKIKLNPFKHFAQMQFTGDESPIVMIGSRSAESVNRQAIIEKYHSGESYFDDTDPSYRRYAPIKDWGVNEVWHILGQRIAPGQYEDMEPWESPWGTSNIGLVELYDSTNSTSGECPLVETASSPGCGKSRFGCWTCTVVTKDKAIDGLIANGETWLEPLAKFRNFLHSTTEPSVKKLYRQDRRRDGKVSVKHGLQEEKEVEFIQGPYFLHLRKEWLAHLLNMEKDLNLAGHEASLITEDELHEIRYQWRNDPLTPDWADELPAIYASVYGENKITFPKDDVSNFGELEASIIDQLALQHDASPDLVRKLIELEVSLSGLGKRQGLFKRIDRILAQDWGSVDHAKSKRENEKAIHFALTQDLTDIDAELDGISAMLNKEF